MIIRITSENPDFSFLIKKNPASGVTIKAYKNGFATGHFSKDNSYDITFLPEPNKTWEDNGHLDYTPYYSPIGYFGLLNLIVRDLVIKDVQENDYPCLNKIQFSYILSRDNLVQTFKNNFPELNIELLNNGSVIISGTSTLKSLIEKSSIFLLLHVRRKDLYSYNDSFNEKVLRILESGKRFYSYSLISKILTTFFFYDTFKNYKERIENLIEQNCNLEIKFLQSLRKDKIASLARETEQPHWIDIGAGEGDYSFIADIINGIYTCVDRDPECRQSLRDKGLNPYKSIKEVDIKYNTCILLTEVIEHSSLTDSKKLLTDLILNNNIKSIIITVPNCEFNKYYNIPEGEFRHYDHNWEPTKEQFINLIESLKQDFNAEYFNIGTEINNVSPTIGVYLKRK